MFRSIVTLILVPMFFSGCWVFNKERKRIIDTYNNGGTIICSHWFKNYAVNKKNFQLIDGWFISKSVTFKLDKCIGTESKNEKIEYLKNPFKKVF